MFACTCTDTIVMTSMSPQFCRYLYLSDLTQIGRVIKILIWLRTEDGPPDRGQKHDIYMIWIWISNMLPTSHSSSRFMLRSSYFYIWIWISNMLPTSHSSSRFANMNMNIQSAANFTLLNFPFSYFLLCEIPIKNWKSWGDLENSNLIPKILQYSQLKQNNKCCFRN